MYRALLQTSALFTAVHLINRIERNESTLTTSSDKTSITYRDAGVDIEAGDALVEQIKPFAKRTLRPEVMGGIGGFGSLFAMPKKNSRSQCWFPGLMAWVPNSNWLSS